MTLKRGGGPGPFIIWTLQRTGGTNLTHRLVERSGLPATEHEPFNRGRRYGAVTQAWRVNQDPQSLAESMTAIVANGEIIKHCVEVVAWPVTQALAEASVRAGYRHLFLFRDQSRDRLLSLHFAKQTGIWGPQMKTDAAPVGASEHPISVDGMIAHEKLCVSRLKQTWRLLLEHGAQPMAVSYEAIYRVAPEEAEASLQPVLERLGLACTLQEVREFVQEVLTSGDQGTRDRYREMPGVCELEEALKSVAPFSLSSQG